MSDIEIKIADASEVCIIDDFITEHFLPHEPIQMSHVRKDEIMEPLPPDLIRECIASQTTLVAFKGSKLVGVLIAGEVSAEADEFIEDEQKFGAKAADIFGFLNYIEKKADYCHRLNIPRSLHIHIVNIHADHFRQGIAKKLFSYCIENGRRKNFPAMTVDCTSFFTSKIAETFDMTCVSTITYDEYNEHVGQTLFVPREPHTEIKSFVKLFD